MLLLTLQIPLATGQGIVWSSDWSGSAPPAFAFDASYYLRPYPGESKAAPVTFGPNGDMLLISPSQLQLDNQVLRLDATGALLWATNFYSQAILPGNVASSILADDGGAFVAFGDATDLYGLFAYPDYVASIDGTGATRWLRTIAARQLVMPSPQVLIAAGHTGVIALDPATGNVRWQFRGCYGAAGCSFGGIVKDGASNLYAVYDQPGGPGGLLRHVIRLDLTGAVIWDVQFAAPESLGFGPGAVPIGVAGTELFLRSDGDVRALRTTDGAMLWTNPIRAADALLAGASPEPVAITSSSLSRLAADTGEPRWSVGLPNVDIAAAVSGAIIAHCRTQSTTSLEPLRSKASSSMASNEGRIEVL